MPEPKYYRVHLTLDFEAANDEEAYSMGKSAEKWLERLDGSAGADLKEVEEIDQEGAS